MVYPDGFLFLWAVVTSIDSKKKLKLICSFQEHICVSHPKVQESPHLKDELEW